MPLKRSKREYGFRNHTNVCLFHKTYPLSIRLFNVVLAKKINHKVWYKLLARFLKKSSFLYWKERKRLEGILRWRPPGSHLCLEVARLPGCRQQSRLQTTAGHSYLFQPLPQLDPSSLLAIKGRTLYQTTTSLWSDAAKCLFSQVYRSALS